MFKTFVSLLSGHASYMQVAINYNQYLVYIGNFMLAKKIITKDLHFA